MLKFSIVAAAVVAAISLAPIPVVTGPAVAQRFVVPPNDPKPAVSTYSCRNELGYLRRVYENELDRIEDANRVWVTPVCMGEDFGLIRNEGNAGALRARIAGSDAMMRALRGKDFRPDDVVGVRMTGEDTVILYVHPFHH
ncbi:MAG: hypothetical protein ACYCZU_01745 [Devosia sp.]